MTHKEEVNECRKTEKRTYCEMLREESSTKGRKVIYAEANRKQPSMSEEEELKRADVYRNYTS